MMIGGAAQWRCRPAARGGVRARELDWMTVDGAAPVIHPSAWIAPGAVLVGKVTLGRSASVWYGAVVRADEDEIVVGPESNIQDHCCLHTDDGEPVLLAERVSLGHRAMVHGGRVVRDLTDQDRMGFAHTSAHYVDRAARHRGVVARDPG